jgi:hypothetical protein
VKSTITSGITPPAVMAPQTARINNKSRRPRVAAGRKYPTFMHTRRRETQINRDEIDQISRRR